jgi:adenylate cyclase
MKNGIRGVKFGNSVTNPEGVDMATDHIEDRTHLQDESKGRARQRVHAAPKNHRHLFWPWVQGVRIPIFIKLAASSIILVFLVVSTISFSMLNRQRKQFVGQLISLGESVIRIAAGNAPDKVLGEEDLALFQLVNDIAKNEHVVYALITDEKSIIKAHSNIEEVNKIYSPPTNTMFLKKANDVKVSSFVHRGEEILFFEKPLTYQKLRVGGVHLAISQRSIVQGIHDAKVSILVLTVITTLVGLMLSLGLSRYFSSPIMKLRAGARAFGMGNFDHRVSIKRNDELGDLGSAFNVMAKDLALKERIKDSFGRYVAPEIVDVIVENPDHQWMKGSEVEASVMFADIRDFTTLSEDKEPESIVELLNDYFTRVTEVVVKHGGHINKFVGDAAMAVFGTPVPNLRHAEAAVRAGLDIQKEITRLDREEKMADVAIQVGIGINSGAMVAGNLGSQRRMEYTVIGDNVNVASRLTSRAKAGEILITGQTYELIKDKDSLKIEKRRISAVKGRKTKIRIFNVLGLREDQHEDGRQEAQE